MISSMNTAAVKEICSWQYPSPYDVYNYMSFDEAAKSNSPLLKSENKNNYICFWEDGTLTAYINIYKKNEMVFLGIGLSPDFCGKGYGKTYLKCGLETVSKRYPNSKILIQVRSWNVRAIKCYERFVNQI